MGAAWLGPWTFASVADEKVARVFEAPRNFVEEVRALGVRDLAQSEVSTTTWCISGVLRKRRAIDQQRLVYHLLDCRIRLSVMVCDTESAGFAIDVSTSIQASPELDSSRPRRRPFEGELASITLWPEIEKVFGHGYEVS
jgi:elongator complex protein 2